MLKTSLCLLAAFSSLGAETVVDQQFTPPNNFVRLDTQIGIPSHFAGAQTFVPEISGQLAAVDFWIGVINGSSTANLRGHAQSQGGGNYDYLPGQGWLTENGQDWNPYAGSDFDYVFRTHMVVPEPRVIYLLLPGLLLLTYLNRSRAT